MRTMHTGGIAAVACAVGLCVADPALAQSTRPPVRPSAHPKTTPRSAEAERVKITKLNGLKAQDRARTPNYRAGNVPGSVKPQQEWVRIQAVYDTASDPAWIDELGFEYFVLCHNRMPPPGQTPYSLFKTAVRYGDIESGRDHLSEVYLRPCVVKRFGEPVAIAVEVSDQGKVVARESDGDRSLPKEWWRNPQVVESKEVTLRDGYLLNRSQTPFALVNADDYEFIK